MAEIVEVQTVAELQQCLQIRLQVFVHEQQVPETEELDRFDAAPPTIHLLAREGDEALGTLRILPGEPGQVHIGRVAVSILARRKGVGSQLMRCAHQIALERFADSAGQVVSHISAQEQAIPFYACLGYKLVSDRRYLDAGIWHKDLIWCGQK